VVVTWVTITVTCRHSFDNDEVILAEGKVGCHRGTVESLTTDPALFRAGETAEVRTLISRPVVPTRRMHDEWAALQL